jgi:GTP pyrophosphokinase
MLIPASDYKMDSDNLLKKASKYLPPEKIELIEAAYQFASNAHKDQLRKSGSPYIEHPLETAITLTELQLDAATLAAALLHDVNEDCGIPFTEIEAKFGSEVSKLVEGTTKLSRLSLQSAKGDMHKSQAENLRKMLIAMVDDLRVVFIKLADRLHNMKTLGALSPEKRRSIARETLDIYAPLAHRLGIWQIKWQLEDLSFRYLEPKEYHATASLVASRRAQREDFISNVTHILEQELEKEEVKAKVFGRPKHIYSLHNKIERYAAQGKDFSNIHDLFAVRVLVDNVSDCYKALGIIHNLWHPLPEEFTDYIANPKTNGYQSLHTTVLSQGAIPLEIQIRTHDMHRIADYGFAAHWRYKESGKADIQFDDKLAWLRQLIEWQNELDSDQFLESLKTDIFIDQVFVYTPNGEIKALPRGATPLDFAYLIHTELGQRCIGAKVNGKLVPLNHELKNGEIIEIMTTKTDKGPSLDWLNTDLGYVKTSHARGKIRQWFNKQERVQNIERGKQLLEREIRRLGIELPGSEEIARLLSFESYDDFLAAFGSGSITGHQLMKLMEEDDEEETPPAVAKVAQPERFKVSGVQVLGVGDLLTHLAVCCNPLPGDDIIGFITRSQGVSVHRKDCINVVNVKEKERLIDVNWGRVQEVYPVNVQINVWNRVGVLRDITTIIAEQKVNISGLNAEDHGDNTTIFAILEIRNIPQLNQLLSKISSISGVISAIRHSYTKASVN